MKHWFSAWLGAVALLVAGAAHAEYHTFKIEQIYSTPDGSAQFIVLHESQGMNGENLLMGQALRITHGGATKSYAFPQNLPGGECGYYGCASSPTAGRRVLIGNDGFAALGIVTPDYTFPGMLLPLDGGVINYADVDFLNYGPLPTDGVSALNRSGAMIPNVATNFDRESGSVTAPAVKNFQGLWWNPAESGWGINLAHQGDLIYLTWYTYDANGKASWLAMLGTKNAAGAYVGDILEFHGPPYTAATFAPAPAGATVGSGTLAFTDANNGTLSYTAKGVTQSKAITRAVFGTMPTCTYAASADLATATNYQDLWWNPSESGWGINLSHQGSQIFATWYTYDSDGSPLWLATLMSQSGPGSYHGDIVRYTGPAFGPTFDRSMVVSATVGSATLTFANGDAATLAYAIGATTGNKSMSRFQIGPGGTVCR